MIKFFRNIRQHMIKENKVSKYLFYAIGEILLVVIGIIIAVQIGNWNNKVNREKLEKVLLAQIKDELSSIYGDIESDLHILELGTRSNFRILDYIQENVSYADSMCFDFYWLAKDEYIYPESSVYSRIKEVGFDIIKNESVKQSLQRLYEAGFPRISKDNSFHPDIETYFAEYYQNHFEPNSDYSLKFEAIFLSDTIQYPIKYKAEGRTRFYTTGFVPLDFEALKKDPKFKMLMKQTEVFRQYKLRVYNGVKNGIEKVLSLIDKELAND